MELTDPARAGRPGNSTDSSVCLPNIGVTDLRCAQLYMCVPGTQTATLMLVYQACYCWSHLPRQRGDSIRYNRLFVSLSFPSGLESWPGEDHGSYVTDGNHGGRPGGDSIGSPQTCTYTIGRDKLDLWSQGLTPSFGPLSSSFSLGLMLVGILQCL